MFKRRVTLTCLGLFLLYLSACGPKPVMEPDSALDSAQYHYQRGMTELDTGRFKSARDAFERARALDPDFPGSYVGLGLLLAEEGEFEAAKEQLGEARKRGGKFAPVYTAEGRVIMTRGIAKESQSSDWLSAALKQFDTAIKHSQTDPSEALFYRSEAYVLAQEYRPAEDDLRSIIDLNRGEYVERAHRRMQVIQQLQRVTPGTIIGLKIAQMEEITRAELAVLFMEELELEEVVQKHRPEKSDINFTQIALAQNPRGIPLDIGQHWAHNWIKALLRLEIPGFEVGPDGNFAPDQELTRAAYAKKNAGILMLITGDSTLENRYLGEASYFPDIRSDYWAYGAIRLCVDRGIMSADRISGAFRPQDPVSGIEALAIIRDLQNALRMEFD
jgi:hypothetical protein